MSYKYISLFCGIGGFDTAANNLGGECVLASEIDTHAQLGYKTLYGHETEGDVTLIDEKDVPEHDLLLGGTPCQSFSISGLRKGFGDTRGTLFFELERIAKEKQPKVVVIENVKGLVGHDNGRTLEIMVNHLNEIGYRVDFKIINSKYFGVPQSRERIYIIAVREDLVEQRGWIIRGGTVVPQAKRLLQRKRDLKTFNFPFPEGTDNIPKLSSILEDTVDSKYYLFNEKSERVIKEYKERESLEKEPKKKRQVLFSKSLYKEEEDGVKQIGLLDTQGFEQNNRVYHSEGLSPTLVTGGTCYVYLGDISEEDKDMLLKERDISKDRKGYIRRLTPKEFLRLQAFPEYYYDRLRGAGISDSQIYKQAGNAVTVTVIEALIQAIIDEGYL